ncbi:RUN domain containing protein [Ditylenchus destructor]|nr:RUN domain containing protein [Ditylenchus destructor]
MIGCMACTAGQISLLNIASSEKSNGLECLLPADVTDSQYCVIFIKAEVIPTSSNVKMVELCELKLMSNGVGDCWPPDIDEHVAQLDFADDPLHSSSAMGQSSVFNSIRIDPSVISTDSLMDMDTFRRRCETNKNDYKLTNFEDSGQWTTTSAIGMSITPGQRYMQGPEGDEVGSQPWSSPLLLQNTKRSIVLKRFQQIQTAEDGDYNTLLNGNNHFGLALLEQLNDLEAEMDGDESGARREARRKAIMDNVLNHNCVGEMRPEISTGGLTTWGRIQSGDTTAVAPFDEKTYSLPELNDYNRQQPFNNRRTLASSDNVTAVTADGRRPVSTGCEAPLHLPAPPPPPKPLHQQQSSASSTTSAGSRRPASLLANFVEHQQLSREQCGIGLSPPQNREPSQQDYEYTEIYAGNGRYVDVNENEIGFVPHSTAAIQRADRWRNHHQPQQQNNSGVYQFGSGSHFAQAALTVPAPPPRSATSTDGAGNSPRVRTFADLSPSYTAPDLKFLSLSHKVPSLCRSSTSLDGMLKRARQGAYLTDYNLEDERLLLFDGVTGHGLSSSSHMNGAKDSGLGSCSSSGPSHIEDWQSLAALLPRHVVDACSFFKSNASLLTGSASSSNNTNNIERKMSRPDTTGACRTCFCVRRQHCLHPPNWAKPTPRRNQICDCTSGETNTCCGAGAYVTRDLPSLQFGANRHGRVNRLKLHAQELSIVGLPIYAIKRQLVERVVEGVAEIARGASSIVLLSALERLLADGLMDGFRPWMVIVEITGPGPATNCIFQLVKTLEVSEKPENSRVDCFFRELLKLNSLDGWLSYVALKENVLARLYTDTAFLLRANTAYRSLFWRIIESIELLSVLTQCNQNSNWMSTSQPSSARLWGSASRLPSDSRVPKSSSVPARLTSANKTEVFSEEETKVDKECVSQKCVTNMDDRILHQLQPSSLTCNSSNNEQDTRSNTMPLRSSKIPVIQSPSSSTLNYSDSSRPRSRSTFYKSGVLSPNSPVRSRSQLRPVREDQSWLNTSSNTNSRLSRIPVRVSPIGLM